MLSYNPEGVEIEFRKDTTIDDVVAGKCSYKYNLIYVVSGKGKWIVEGEEIPFEENSVYIFKPLTYYTVNTSGSDTFDRYCISFPRAALHERMLKGLDSMFLIGKEESTYAEIEYFPKDDVERVLSSLDYVDKLADDQKDQYLATVVSQLLILLTSSDIEFPYSASDETNARIAAYINHNVTNGHIPSLDEIAKRFFISKYYLCRMFKKKNGVSVHTYINQKRIMLAKQYIDSGMSASAAADMVGYTDYSAFYRAYVKVVGDSPKSRKE